jgi:hypothetical protein
LREVVKLSESEIRQLLDAGIIATRPNEAEQPVSSSSTGRPRGLLFDPDYRQYVRDLGEPIVAAPGDDD